MIVEIADPDDDRVSAFRARDRQLAPGQPKPEAPLGLFVAEGDLVVVKAIELGYEPYAVLSAATLSASVVAAVEGCDPGVPIYTANPSLRASLTGYGVQLDVVGLFHRRAAIGVEFALQHARRIVVLEAVDNPVNLGVIARTAAGLGFDALVIAAASADPYARRAVRTSMGATLELPCVRYDSLDQLTGFTTVALTPDESAADLDTLHFAASTPVALLLGEERSGLRPATMAAADHLVRVPMHRGVDSLNVAAAAAIACYALRRR